MTETYSLAKVGRSTSHGEANNTNLLNIPDSIARDGNILGSASTGARVLCKGYDGSQNWYVVDPERSTPSVPVMKRV